MKKYIKVYDDVLPTQICSTLISKFELNKDNQIAVLIPPGFGNAFCVSSDEALYHYKLAYDGGYNDFDNQFTFAWNDESIGIDWKIGDPIISERDMIKEENGNN